VARWRARAQDAHTLHPIYASQRLSEARLCCLVGEGAIRPPSRLNEPSRRPRVSRRPEVVGDGVGVRLRHYRDHLADLPVQPLAPDGGDALVERLPRQRMKETHRFALSRLHQHARLTRMFDQAEQRILIHFSHRLPEIKRHGLPDHRRHRKQPLRFLAEPGEPGINHLPQKQRYLHRCQFADALPIIRFIDDHFLCDCAQQFHREEGIAARPLVQVRYQPRRVRCREPVAIHDYRLPIRDGETVQVEARRARLSRQDG